MWLYGPNKQMFIQELRETNYTQHLSFAENMSQKLEDDKIDLNDLLMSDEAHFELSGSVIKGSCSTKATSCYHL